MKDYQKLLQNKEKVINDLKQSVLRFSFQKKNGMTRIAYGTLHPDIIDSKTDENYTESRFKNTTIVPFYDIEIGDWRSFDITRLITVDVNYGQLE